MGARRKKDYKENFGVSRVAHACNPIYFGGGDWKDYSLRPIWEKISEIQSQSVIWAWWSVPVRSKASTRQKQDPS
jgi:hypothetical protein